MRAAILATCLLTGSTPALAVSGALEDEGFTAVVAVDAGGPECTGTLVDALGRGVLTASSCIPEGVAPDGVVVTADDGTSSVRSLRYIRHHEADIAIIHLDAVLDLPAMIVSPGPVQYADVGKTVHLVGFGESAADAGDGGVRRWGTSTIASLPADQFTTTTGESTLCAGDLGAPALERASLGFVQVGVASSARCGVGQDSFVRLEAVVPWLQAQGVRVSTSPLDSVASYRCDGPDGPLDGLQPIAVGAEIACLPPTWPAVGERTWDWGDGRQTPAEEDGATTHAFEAAGTYEIGLCEDVVLPDGDPVSRCTGHVQAWVCPEPDASFRIEQGDTVTARPTAAGSSCDTADYWIVRDLQGTFVASSRNRTARFDLDAGTYDIEHRVRTYVGPAGVTQTVDVAESGCSTLSARSGAGLLLSLLPLLWRRRR